MTHTVPIFEGYAIPHAITPIPICGKMLTEYMLNLMKQVDDTMDSLVIAEAFKIAYGEVAMDYDAQLKTAKDSSDTEPYILPNGQKMQGKNFKAARLECPD